jgi:hypothetical protein
MNIEMDLMNERTTWRKKKGLKSGSTLGEGRRSKMEFENNGRNIENETESGLQLYEMAKIFLLQL